MYISGIFVVGAVLFGLWLGRKYVIKAWRKADVADKLEEIDTLEENAKRVKEVKSNEVKKNKNKIDQTLDL